MKTTLLASTHSGCGKTTLTLVLLQYFRQTKHNIYTFADAGTSILAECGGAIVLGKTLVAINGDDGLWQMFPPYVFIMQTHLVVLEHREEASGVKGHEFQYAKRELDEGLPPAFDLAQGNKGVLQKCQASYVHWYFASALNQACIWL
jgi:cobyrinic acid a,c-diamide synthase